MITHIAATTLVTVRDTKKKNLVTSRPSAILGNSSGFELIFVCVCIKREKKELKRKTKKKDEKMSIFRSEKMSLYQLFLQNESAYRCMSELGELGCVEFRDVSTYIYLFSISFLIVLLLKNSGQTCFCFRLLMNLFAFLIHASFVSFHFHLNS